MHRDHERATASLVSPRLKPWRTTARIRSRWASTLSDTRLIVSPVLRYVRDTLSLRARSNRYRARSKLVEAIAPAGYCRLTTAESGAWLVDFWDPAGAGFPCAA